MSEDQINEIKAEIAAWTARVDAFPEAHARLNAGTTLLAMSREGTPWHEHGIATILKHVDAPELSFPARLNALEWALDAASPGSALGVQAKSKLEEVLAEKPTRLQRVSRAVRSALSI
ncbi:MAG: hypothetical protein M3N08_07915 [Pseudomonadota bacterium]|nr:hypothetical protein [Pseudomonadota bacterium]